MRRRSLSVLGIGLGFGLAVTGCGNGATGGTEGSGGSYGQPSTGGGPATSTTPVPGPGGTPPEGLADGGASAEAGATVLDSRVLDYGDALRTASLKLVGDLPTLAQIQAIENATPAKQATIYAADIDAMLKDPRFTTQIIQYFRDTFKTGDQGQQGQNGLPDFDTAALFAAMTVVNGQPFTNIITAKSGTCPTFSAGTFTAKDCGNSTETAGIITDPGIEAQYFVPMAFRRIRFIQEIFVCSPFPAEYASKPVPKGKSLYTSPWPFDSIAGPNAPINFQDTSAIICANCHTTLNHMAPLFGYFDMNGKYVPGQFQVQTPVAPPVTSQITDWLPASEEKFAWRDGTPVTDLTTLAAAIAKDPDVPVCAINRVWDWAFNRGDIVNDLATVPTDVTQTYVQGFTKSGMNLKQVIKDIFTSDDFVRF